MDSAITVGGIQPFEHNYLAVGPRGQDVDNSTFIAAIEAFGSSFDSLSYADYCYKDMVDMSKMGGLNWSIIQKQMTNSAIDELSTYLTFSGHSFNRFTLQACYLTRKIARRMFTFLANNQHFTELHIEKCWFDDKVFTELRKAIADGGGNLKILSIAEMKCSGMELVHLIRELIKKKCTLLSLKNCVIKLFSQKESLELQKILTEGKGCLSTVELINLKMENTSEFPAFLKAIIQARISALHIEACCIDSKSGVAQGIMTALASGTCSLQTLHFCGSTFDVESFRAIATGIIAQNWHPDAVSNLGFESCGLDYTYGEAINYLLNCTQIKCLNLQSNIGLGSSANSMRALLAPVPLPGEVLPKTKLRAVPMFVFGIRNNYSLELLNLANCGISDQDFDDFLKYAMREGLEEKFWINFEGNGLRKKREESGKLRRMPTKGRSPRALSPEEIGKRKRMKEMPRASPGASPPITPRDLSRFRIKSAPAQEIEGIEIISGDTLKKRTSQQLEERQKRSAQFRENLAEKKTVVIAQGADESEVLPPLIELPQLKVSTPNQDNDENMS